MSSISEKLAEVRARKHQAEDIVRDCEVMETILVSIYAKEMVNELQCEGIEPTEQEEELVPEVEEEATEEEKITIEDIIINEALDELDEATEPVVEDLMEEVDTEVEEGIEEADNPVKEEEAEIEEAKEEEVEYSEEDEEDEDDDDFFFA